MKSRYLFRRVGITGFLNGIKQALFKQPYTLSAYEIEQRGKLPIWKFEGMVRSDIYPKMDDPVQLAENMSVLLKELEGLKLQDSNPEMFKITAFGKTRQKMRKEKFEGELTQLASKLRTMVEMQAEGKEVLPIYCNTTALYFMEKFGLRDVELYKNVIFPSILKKLDYIDYEGISNSIWAITNAGLTDEPILKSLIEKAKDTQFPPDFYPVLNAFWNPEILEKGKERDVFHGEYVIKDAKAKNLIIESKKVYQNRLLHFL